LFIVFAFTILLIHLAGACLLGDVAWYCHMRRCCVHWFRVVVVVVVS
jgi:hypothetical protein